jgi:hypothetical protein
MVTLTQFNQARGAGLTDAASNAERLAPSGQASHILDVAVRCCPLGGAPDPGTLTDGGRGTRVTQADFQKLQDQIEILHRTVDVLCHEASLAALDDFLIHDHDHSSCEGLGMSASSSDEFDFSGLGGIDTSSSDELDLSGLSDIGPGFNDTDCVPGGLSDMWGPSNLEDALDSDATLPE